MSAVSGQESPKQSIYPHHIASVNSSSQQHATPSSEQSSKRAGEKTQQTPLPVWISALAGTISGAITALFMGPLDVVRTRYMVSKQDGRRMHQTIIEVVKTDGWRGLWMGLTPTLIGLMPSWAISWSTYHILRNYQTQVLHLDETSSLVHVRCTHSIWQSFSLTPISSALCKAAMGAGIATAIGTNPIWVVKTRIQTQTMIGESRHYNGLKHCVETILKEEGVKGLYKGLPPSLFGVVHVCVQFPVYEKLKHKLTDRTTGQISTTNIILASAIAKAVASVAAYPHEVLRARQQKDRTGQSRQLWKLVVEIFTTEGIRGFYRGMSINLVRVVPTAAITFTSFEYVSSTLLKWSGLADPALR